MYLSPDSSNTNLQLHVLYNYSSKKLCAWRHNMPPAPASLAIISCKYENRQRLQFTTEFAKTNIINNMRNKHCAILPSLCRHCQSKAKHSRIRAQALPFCPWNQLTFWPWKWCPCDLGYLCDNFSLVLCSRVRPDVRDRQTDVRQKHHLMPIEWIAYN